jgi:hypothetical protein
MTGLDADDTVVVDRKCDALESPPAWRRGDELGEEYAWLLLLEGAAAKEDCR